MDIGPANLSPGLVNGVASGMRAVGTGVMNGLNYIRNLGWSGGEADPYEDQDYTIRR